MMLNKDYVGRREVVRQTGVRIFLWRGAEDVARLARQRFETRSTTCTTSALRSRRY